MVGWNLAVYPPVCQNLSCSVSYESGNNDLKGW
jgi:hypothetical protein